jgi:hypothetical protein
MRYLEVYLYTAGGIVASVLFGIELYRYYAQLETIEIIVSAVPLIVLFYLAFKSYREKHDEDLM